MKFRWYKSCEREMYFTLAYCIMQWCFLEKSSNVYIRTKLNQDFCNVCIAYIGFELTVKLQCKCFRLNFYIFELPFWTAIFSAVIWLYLKFTSAPCSTRYLATTAFPKVCKLNQITSHNVLYFEKFIFCLQKSISSEKNNS